MMKSCSQHYFIGDDHYLTSVHSLIIEAAHCPYENNRSVDRHYDTVNRHYDFLIGTMINFNGQ